MLNSKLSEKTLTKIKDFTEINYHLEARLEIAQAFAYCGNFRRQFEAIQTIYELEGSMPYDLSKYVYSLTERMFDTIERVDGKEVIDALREAL